ncbi:kremen protein 1 isoform X3 [Hippocampus zosterae]|uniref:kremen protein 1 isoform X3 n=1 Tax=Hippocampus zosterae TaxID=109293 RepID=UPI00223D6DEF|nr:kremen protein 1 isoform X3 [Hippocampus zosterae]
MEPRTAAAAWLLLAGFSFLSSASLSHLDTECYTANGEDYRGFQKQTSLPEGKACLFWNETFQHPYNTLKYPNGEGGLGSHNYCRNPDGDVQPWCYIADHEDGIYWRYCDIPTCQMPGNLGCFRDSGDPPTLSGPTETSNKQTIQTCIGFCRKQRYKLAGMESGFACFCGNEADLAQRGPAPGADCNHVCFGDHRQPCGGDGWLIVFDTRVGSCGGNYSSPSGVIYSPDFPDKYGAGRACYWTVQVSGASAILFNFTLFDISDQADMVELLNGYTKEVVARFDRRAPPRRPLNVTADFVILYFYSDGSNQARGFVLLYQAWTIYALAGLLVLTVAALLAKLLLHITLKSPRIPAASGSDGCGQSVSTSSEPWIILYRPSTISLFKKKLKNHHHHHHGDLSPLVGN